MDDSHESGRSRSTGEPVLPAPTLPLGLDEQPTVISKPNRLAEMSSGRPTDLARGLEGERLGHFQLEEFVGGGGMGAVFRALDLELSRTVAVKVVPCDKTDEETLRRFKNEAQSAARLDHARIARVFYVGVDKGWHYIVFEFIEGVNIRDLVQHKGPLSLEEAVQYTRQVAEALDHAWHREVVHRDIKPSNILVMQDGTVKVVDMGLARLHQVESSSEDLTSSGVTLGTFDYISPEQARDPREADVRSDLYSLGCTLYYMLTGRPPFPEGTVLQKLLRHSSEAPPRVTALRPDLPEPIAEVIGRMLSKRPDDRHQTPAELIAALDTVAKLAGFEVAPTTVLPQRLSAPAAKESAWIGHIAWVVPLLALILIGTALEWPREEPSVIASSDLKLLPAQPALVATPETPGAPAPSIDDQQPPQESLQPVSLEAGGASIGDELESAAGPPPEETEATATALAPQDPTKIIVRGRGQEFLPGVAAVDSLEEALRRLAESPEIKTIELQFNGEMVVSPIRIAAPRAVTLQAADGYAPRLVFAPQSPELPDDQRMISVSGAELAVKSIGLQLELPRSPYQGWSLFHLKRFARLELQDCLLTIRDQDNVHDEVAFLEIEGRSYGEMPSSGAPDASPQMSEAAISIDRCVARGPASLIRCPVGSPFYCTWNSGLLATTRRLLDAQGSMMNSELRRVMRINLTNVTVYAEQGLALVDLQSNPHLLKLDLDLTDCVVDCPLSNALIEHRGVESLEQAREWTSVSGVNTNLIEAQLLHHDVLLGIQEFHTLPLSPLDLAVKGAPRFKALSRELPIDAQLPRNFELDFEGHPPGGPVTALQAIVDRK